MMPTLDLTNIYWILLQRAGADAAAASTVTQLLQIAVGEQLANARITARTA